MKSFYLSLIFLFSLSFSVGCSTIDKDLAQDAAIGGAAGTVAGAGTGALVGAVIANGDIGASAMLGAGIGLPVGIIAGVAVHNYLEDSEIEENNKQIQANYQYIVERQKEINRLREEVTTDYQTINLDSDLRQDDFYTGPTIGVYNR